MELVKDLLAYVFILNQYVHLHSWMIKFFLLHIRNISTMLYYYINMA